MKPNNTRQETSSGTSTSSHAHGTPSTENNVHHSLPKKIRRHGNAIRQKRQEVLGRHSIASVDISMKLNTFALHNIKKNKVSREDFKRILI